MQIVIWSIVGIVVFLLLLTSIYTVKQQTFAVIERFGKYARVTAPGIHVRIPLGIESVVGRVSIRVRELNVEIKTKTSDNVFVDMLIAVQFFVDKNSVWDAFYKLTDPQAQMESYVFDVVRAKVPTMILDDVFEKKEEIAIDVKEKLASQMVDFGYTILTALVNDIQPEAKVATAMNEINAQQRLRVAAEHQGEAKKILVVKEAEADAESKKLSGKGIADQRTAIIEGLRNSVKEFEQAVKGVSATDVMTLVLMTQYYDMLTDIGKSSNQNTVLIPHSPAAVGDMQKQIIEAILTGQAASIEKE